MDSTTVDAKGLRRVIPTLSLLEPGHLRLPSPRNRISAAKVRSASGVARGVACGTAVGDERPTMSPLEEPLGKRGAV